MDGSECILSTDTTLSRILILYGMYTVAIQYNNIRAGSNGNGNADGCDNADAHSYSTENYTDMDDDFDADTGTYVGSY